MRWRFDGEIAAFGTTSGHRIVVGRWPVSPFGPVNDVMLEAPDGTRLLIAPSDTVARFIASTYRFDSVEVSPVQVIRQPGRLGVTAGPLSAELTVGRRGWLGLLLRAVPRPVATAPAWAAVVNPLARTIVPGVRAPGAGSGTEPGTSTRWCPSPSAGGIPTSGPWPSSGHRSGSVSARRRAGPRSCA